MMEQNSQPLTIPRTDPERAVNDNAMLIISKTGNLSMLVGQVVRKNFETRSKVISAIASLKVMRFTSKRFTMGSVTAESTAATVAAVTPCAAAAKTFVKKLFSGSS